MQKSQEKMMIKLTLAIVVAIVLLSLHATGRDTAEQKKLIPLTTSPFIT